MDSWVRIPKKELASLLFLFFYCYFRVPLFMETEYQDGIRSISLCKFGLVA